MSEESKVEAWNQSENTANEPPNKKDIEAQKEVQMIDTTQYPTLEIRSPSGSSLGETSETEQQQRKKMCVCKIGACFRIGPCEISLRQGFMIFQFFWLAYMILDILIPYIFAGGDEGDSIDRRLEVDGEESRYSRVKVKTMSILRVVRLLKVIWVILICVGTLSAFGRNSKGILVFIIGRGLYFVIILFSFIFDLAFVGNCIIMERLMFFITAMLTIWELHVAVNFRRCLIHGGTGDEKRNESLIIQNRQGDARRMRPEQIDI